jgi:hydrogenase expression/formation protein HypC
MCLAIPGQVVTVDENGFLATVDVSGVRRKVNVQLLTGDQRVVTGDWVLIHVGFAMSKIGAEEAAEQMRLLRMLGESEQAMSEVEGYGSG